MMPDKRIHTKSFPNVETERLHARLEYIRANRVEMLRGNSVSKETLRALARETVNVERELTHRCEQFVCVTNGAHLQVPTETERHIRPFTRSDTHYGGTR